MATARWAILSAVGGLVVLGTALPVHAQSTVQAHPVANLAAFPPGAIQGTVLDEQGRPVAGAVVSAVGGSTIVAVTDKAGHFELRGLPPGPYLVRAHLGGFVTPQAQIIQVRSSVRVDSSIALRHTGALPTPVLAAGFGTDSSSQPATAAAVPDQGARAAAPSPSNTEHKDGQTDDSETAWRLRHMRRSILKDLTLPADVLAGNFVPAQKTTAADFFARTPFSGQVDFLTSSSFEEAQQLFMPANLPSGIANLSVTAPIGDHGDWSVRGAFMQADMAAWIVSGAYQTRMPATHQYNVGLSYSTQRYDVGNPLALNAATNSRSASEVFAFDTFTLSPVVAITYGTRYARYDYLDGRGLMSPRLELALTPDKRTRIRAMAAESAQAPGAEEFLPPSETGVWLPPQRLFSSLDPDAGLRAEHTTHAALEVERDLGSATVSLAAFHQHSEDQLVTIFGADLPNQPMSKIGHYFVGNAGNVIASGCTAKVRAAITSWLSGSVEYSLTNAQLAPTTDPTYLLLTAPSAVGPRAERIYNVATKLETKLPELATRVVVLYRVGNGYAHPPRGTDPAADRSSLDSRFDVQVRQSLPFMNFTSAKWEMLLGVRNFFREPGSDIQSAYDELLVVRPPKRIVGGLTMQF
jgi:hypothetical protein